MEPGFTAQPASFDNENTSIAFQAGVYNNHGNTTVNQTSGAELERLPHANEAPFNAYVRQHEPFCLPGTRTALLQEIYSWTGAQDERCLYWLNGLAGTGKSTIARTIARELNDRGCLGASFFFSKGGGDVGDARKFVTSIAVQIASHVQGTRQHICEAVTKRPEISSLSLRDQWRHLVLHPLSTLDVTAGITSVVLIIDALDECDDDDDMGNIIELLAETQGPGGLQLRILLTSRPEVPIRHGFIQVPDALLQRYVLHHISPDIVDADIQLYLTRNLMAIGKHQCLPPDWPSPEIVARMTQRASGLFIWAATAHRFVEQGGPFADQRLELIMAQDGDSPVKPEKHLDNIYLTVLRASLLAAFTAEEEAKHCEILRRVLGTLAVLVEPLTVQALGNLLSVGTAHIERTVQGLHAILDIPEERHRPLRLHHPSLRDFLLDRSRCTDANFSVDEVEAHVALLSPCNELITRFVQQEQESGERIISNHSSEWTSRSIPVEVQYACLNFSHHHASAIKLDKNVQVCRLIEDYKFYLRTLCLQTYLEEDRLELSLEVLKAVRAGLNLTNGVVERSRLH